MPDHSASRCCSCGQLTLTARGDPMNVSICHRVDRRCGSGSTCGAKRID
jgi:hypothetical protein